MTHIKITDLNPSHPEIGSELEELTDEELLAINGSGWITGAMRFVANQIYFSAAVIDRAADELI